MGSIKIVSGVCGKCGHPQITHEGNQGCLYPVPEQGEPAENCGCESIGSY
jgi:hypothetical protein